MTKLTISDIAIALANVQYQPNIDERTRLMCVSAVEDAIKIHCRQLDKSLDLKDFRKKAKGTREDWDVIRLTFDRKE